MEIFIEIITNLVKSYGYFAVFMLMTLESALIPIPSEVTMPFAGFMSALGYMNIFTVILLGAFGNLMGSLIAYYLGYYKGEQYILLLIKKFGKYLLIRESEYYKSKSWFEKYGQLIAFTSRLLPVVRTFISLPAGIARMDVVKFSILTITGSVIWSAFLAYLGLLLGSNWNIIEPYFRKFQLLIVSVFVIIAILYIYKHIRKENK